MFGADSALGEPLFMGLMRLTSTPMPWLSEELVGQLGEWVTHGLNRERQVAQNKTPLYPKVAHKAAKVAHNYRLLAFQEGSKGSELYPWGCTPGLGAKRPFGGYGAT